MKLFQLGPAVLVTAAFVGPGTVITVSLAGANFGFSLIWALLFSVIATIILQEMAVRLGLVTQQDLGENIRNSLTNPIARAFAFFLVVSAIVIGNGAYQGGNISGASLGLSGLFKNSFNPTIYPIIIGITAFILLYSSRYKLIEGVLILLVAIMSIAFILTAIIAKPNLSEFFTGIFLFELPDGASLTAIALIGTTVVPYNLFLHSATVKHKWQSTYDLPEARKDLFISISLGGLISIAILSTAATTFFGKQISLQSTADLAPALEPILGEFAQIFMATGLFAAGISSAVTAPLAAAFALSGILGLNKNINSISFKIIWMTILILGILVATSGYKAINIIWFAQVANGVLLPIITVFLLWTMNTRRLGNFKNTITKNCLGFIVLLVTLILSGRSLMSAFGLI